jgi:putative endopeptidase
VEGFDYDRYFRSYAGLWKSHVPLSYEKMMVRTDVHPLDFYRINVGMQQFDEFYQTYDVKEGDGMYIDPAKRITVW